jgi:hypothetical protein
MMAWLAYGTALLEAVRNVWHERRPRVAKPKATMYYDADTTRRLRADWGDYFMRGPRD